MKRRACIAAALVALAGCGAPSPEQSRQVIARVVEHSPPSPKPPATWEIRLETHGGYAGAGKGWIEREGEQRIAYEVSWQDDSIDMRPADLSGMADAVWDVHKQLQSRCTP